jgi:hypothetical protein
VVASARHRLAARPPFREAFYMNPPSTPPVPLATPPAPLDSRVRFSLRGMLIGTAVVSVCLAIAAPWLRQLNAKQRTAFIQFSCNVGAGAGAAIVVGCALRLRAERRAGAARYRLPSSHTTHGGFFAAAVALFWAGAFATYASFAIQFNNGGPSWLAIDFTAVQYGFLLALYALGTWWNTACLELCDAGILHGCMLVPYKSIRGFRWGASNPNLLVIRVGWSVVTVRADPADTPAIEQFLTAHLPPPAP